MHRVELKGKLYELCEYVIEAVVPNAPCGVERTMQKK